MDPRHHRSGNPHILVLHCNHLFKMLSHDQQSAVLAGIQGHLAAVQKQTPAERIIPLVGINPLELLVITEVLSLASFRPAVLGSLLPTPQLAQLAREYIYHRRVTGQDTQSTVLYPMPIPTSISPQLFSTEMYTHPDVVNFMSLYLQYNPIIIYQSSSTDISGVENLYTLSVQNTHHNNEYMTFAALSSPNTPSKTMTSSFLFTIYPADNRAIKKHRDERNVMLLETPEIYESCHKPTMAFHLNWLYDVLDGKKEKETTHLNTETYNGDDQKEHIGFLLAKDTKWPNDVYHQLHTHIAQIDAAPMKSDTSLPLNLLRPMWFLAIPFMRGITCLRDLTTDHLPLLKNMKQQISAYLLKTYNMTDADTVMYVHYSPTFYHLHVHVNHVSMNTEATFLGKCVSLNQIIANIEKFPNYYQIMDLEMILPTSSMIVKNYQQYSFQK